MITVILAGGLGSRLSEYTKLIPKPMVEICGEPILSRIIKSYYKFGFCKFIIATGYKHSIIDNYFKKNNKKFSNIEIKTIFTGNNSLTGTRLKKVSKYLKEDNFFLTYGDGLCNVDLKKLLKFHIKHNKLMTITSVHPPARFGELIIKKNNVSFFQEKPQLQKGWINGGFFVINKKFLKLITKKDEMLERGAIQKAVKINQVKAYKHNGFWQCMDTIRDKELLEDIITNKTIIL